MKIKGINIIKVKKKERTEQVDNYRYSERRLAKTGEVIQRLRER